MPTHPPLFTLADVAAAILCSIISLCSNRHILEPSAAVAGVEGWQPLASLFSSPNIFTTFYFNLQTVAAPEDFLWGHQGGQNADRGGAKIKKIAKYV